MIKAQLVDGEGTGEKASVSDGALQVHPLPYPNLNTQVQEVVFRSFLQLDGTGTSDMRINGSSSPVEFSLFALPESDVFITQLSFVIADQGASLSEFGAISSLTNGCSLGYNTQRTGTIDIQPELRSNFDFIQLCLGTPPVGSGVDTFRATNVSGNSEGYLPVLNFKQTFGLQNGIHLRSGTVDKIFLTVRDNLTGVDRFDCVAYGKRILLPRKPNV